jgi:alpha-1,6-mannosyltransferase
VEKAVGPKVAKIAEWVAWRYARLVYRRCQATISAAQMFYQKLVDHKIRNVKYYPFGVDTDIFSPARRSDELRQKLTADDDTVVLLYVGRLNYEKRINILLDAFAALAKTANIRLAFVGDGNLAAEIAERQKKEPRIHLLPYETDREKLGEIYASADIYCTAGPHETFGLCVLEAQAAGLPVVGVNAGALVERVPDGMGLLAEADSVDSFAEQLTLMLNSDYQAIGRRTREYVVEHYSWDYFFKRLLRRYEITYAEKGRLRKRRLKAKPATELG